MLLPAGATGLLAQFAEVGVLGPADVHVATRLAELAGETDDGVRLALAMTVRAVRAGSVCVPVHRLAEISVDGLTDEALAALPWPDAEQLVAALRRSPLVDARPPNALVLRGADSDDGPLLYLGQYFEQEQRLREVLRARAVGGPEVDGARLDAVLDELFPDAGPDGSASDPDQRAAVRRAATAYTTVITGGPGTGKTHTIARVIAALHRLDPSLRIALAAPTGKAAARMQAAIDAQRGALTLPERLRATTVHSLLGARPGAAPKYTAAHRLQADVVVVDETSMVSLPMMDQLVEAVRPHARLVLVGDPDQLASVEAGAVLADLSAGPAQESIVRLTRGHRFRGDIAALAEAIREGDADAALRVLDGSEAVRLLPADDPTELRREVEAVAERTRAAAEAGDIAAALVGLERQRTLCAHREGPYGVGTWIALAHSWIHPVRLDGWAPGEPILVRGTDRELGVFNGDTGVVVVRPDGSSAVAFDRPEGPLLVHPSRLPEHGSAYAMTIHRAQGSQYGSVAVIVPEANSALLSRELLYTAVTRARERVTLYGTEDAVRAGIDRRILRASGLRTPIRPW